NSCKAGVSSGSCKNQNFVLIHFRLQCRDSVETVQSVTDIELIPVRSQPIRWKVGYYTGQTYTDSDGYGQIRLISSGSSRRQRVVLHVKNNYLGLRAEEVSRIVVPRDWCS